MSTLARRASYKARNKAYVAMRRASAVCAHCGAQPIEWHREEHVLNGNRRIPNMANDTFSIAEIEREIGLCTPLCRRCHMRHDGRADRLRKSRFHKLDPEQVRAIRVRYAGGRVSLKSLAGEYGVCFQLISQIVNRQIWKEVE